MAAGLRSTGKDNVTLEIQMIEVCIKCWSDTGSFRTSGTVIRHLLSMWKLIKSPSSILINTSGRLIDGIIENQLSILLAQNLAT